MLCEVLATLEVDGRHWWLASDPADAATRGVIKIAHGYENCFDRLNTLCFEAPVLTQETSKCGEHKLFVLVERAQWLSAEPGFHVEAGRIIHDAADDVDSAFYPLQIALIGRLQS